MAQGAPVVKNLIHLGQEYVPITKGSKVHFHFQTWVLGKQRFLLDDSRMIGKKEPMELVIGHKFKLEVWESIVKMMAVGEVSSFKVKKELVFSYPFVSKTLRELGQDEKKAKHSCTMTLQTEGLGYADLDNLMKNPSDLEFVIEIIKVEKTDEYEKDTWQLTAEDRLRMIDTLKERGNNSYAQKMYEEAEQSYNFGLSLLEPLMVRERHGDEEWFVLNRMKMPLLLNFAQCKLLKGEYYDVIEHCTTVLEYEQDNQKALYRRAKAHIGAWNPQLAAEDFKRLKELNPKMSATIDKELENIKKQIIDKENRDKNALKNLF